MNLKELRVRGYKNLSDVTLRFSDKNILITGRNSQGKSALLEAIALALGYEVNHKDVYLLIKRGLELARIDLTFSIRGVEVTACTKIAGKQIERRIDGKLSSNKEFKQLGIDVNYFYPSAGQLIRGSPQLRRDFFLHAFKEADPKNYKYIQEIFKVVKNRNSLLRLINERPVEKNRYLDELDQWDVLLVEKTRLATTAFEEFLTKLGTCVRENWAEFDHLERSIELTLKYPGYDNLEYHLSLMRDTDIKNGQTSIGIHRFDVGFYVDGMPARTNISNGDQKTLALTVFFAVAELKNKTYALEPLYLIDDGLAELDETRKKTLLTLKSEGQTIMTATSAELVNGYTYYKVVNGQVLKCE